MKVWQAILGGGVTAGLVDIGAASMIFGVGPLRIMRSIAGGLVGRDVAKAGGLDISMLGLALQVGMSLLFAIFYVLVSRRLPILAQRPWLCGAVYGVGVYGVMNYIVVPLSAVHGHAPTDPMMILKNMAAMIVFGLVIALFASRVPVSSPSPAVTSSPVAA